MGDVGLGIYHMIFNFLMICIALTTTGIPTALSCLVAKENALQDKKDANIFFISTLYVAFFISLLISLIVSFNSTYLSFRLLHDENLNLFVLSICSFYLSSYSYYFNIKCIKRIFLWNQKSHSSCYRSSN